MGSHKNASGPNIHIPHALEYADAAERVADDSLDSTYLKKLALQLDDYSLWVLQDLTPTWVPVGGSGGISDPEEIYSTATPDAADDEFDDESIHADWNLVSAHAGTAVWSEERHRLFCEHYNMAYNTCSAYLKAVTLADGEAFESRINIHGTGGNYPAGGIVLTDGILTTSNVFALFFYYNSATPSIGLNSGTLATIGSTSHWAAVNTVAAFSPMRFKIYRVDATHFGLKVAGSVGKFFNMPFTGTTTFNPGFTPTHAGVYAASWNNGLMNQTSFDYFRKVAA